MTREVDLVIDLATAFFHAEHFVDRFDLIIIGERGMGGVRRRDALIEPCAFQFGFEIVERLSFVTLGRGDRKDITAREHSWLRTFFVRRKDISK